MTLIRRVRVVAAIQTRMGSTRLPGKVLRPLAGQPMLGWIVARLRACQEVDQVVVSTTVEPRDGAIVEYAQQIQAPSVRGSEQDLIQRLLLTASEFTADALVRITADCPFVDPLVVDELVRVFRAEEREVDFISNNDPPSFPHGLDAEIIPTPTLKRLDAEVRDPYYREWIPLYIRAHRDRFRIRNVSHVKDLSHHRWTVDYPEDLEFACRVFEALGSRVPVFSVDEAVQFLRVHPEIVEINAMHAERGPALNPRQGARA